ncbi:hypothetical protein [Pararobbsia silviterrae]|uniref:hypothetical protein n=1 Tax=Pararobbsia silviterrae TaxID=1792498 RepID=UPI00197FBE10|nr:hypothetical protein [Pararobbsia silviterrae]
MQANIFQIYYDERTRSQADPGFIPLDNIANTRPDWREYWAIRNYFLNTTLDANALYGFFSPAFRNKTHLSAQDVHAFIEANPGHDVYTFSPFIQDAACYLNVFEQGNLNHPGHLEVAQQYLQTIGLDVDIEKLVMTLRSAVYCNYFVAKPSFWKMWFGLTERLFEMCEANQTELATLLNSNTIYRLPVGMKVFLLERIASLVLALSPNVRVCAYDVRKMPSSEPAYIQYIDQMMLLDRLKNDYLVTQDPKLLEAFYTLRGTIMVACRGASYEPTKKGFIRTVKVKTPHILYVSLIDAGPSFAYPKYVSRVVMNAPRSTEVVSASNLSPTWGPHFESLGPIVGMFAIREYLSKGIKVLRIGLCHDDAFISPPAFVGVALDDEAGVARAMEPGTRDFLFAAPEPVTRDANTPDRATLERLASIAIELGVLRPDQQSALVDPVRVVPGALNVGVYRKDFWIEAVEHVDRVLRGLLKHHTAAELRANGRRWARAVEWLASALLLDHMEQAHSQIDWGAEFCGHLHRRVAQAPGTLQLH